MTRPLYGPVLHRSRPPQPEPEHRLLFKQLGNDTYAHCSGCAWDRLVSRSGNPRGHHQGKVERIEPFETTLRHFQEHHR